MIFKFEKNQKTIRLGLFVIVLAVLGIVTRFLPHPANFTAVGAVGIFAGALFPKKWGAFLPVIIMMVSDLFLGIHQLVFFTWGSMAVAGMIGWQLRNNRTVLSVGFGSLLASIQFFLITNWAVWVFSPLYVKSPSGLLQSYLMGLPFFRNMIAADLFYTAVLFGLYAFALNTFRATSRATARTN